MSDDKQTSPGVQRETRDRAIRSLRREYPDHDFDYEKLEGEREVYLLKIFLPKRSNPALTPHVLRSRREEIDLLPLPPDKLYQAAVDTLRTLSQPAAEAVDAADSSDLTRYPWDSQAFWSFAEAVLTATLGAPTAIVLLPEREILDGVRHQCFVLTFATPPRHIALVAREATEDLVVTFASVTSHYAPQGLAPGYAIYRIDAVKEVPTPHGDPDRAVLDMLVERYVRGMLDVR